MVMDHGFENLCIVNEVSGYFWFISLKCWRQNLDGNMLLSKDSDKLFISVNAPRDNIRYKKCILQ